MLRQTLLVTLPALIFSVGGAEAATVSISPTAFMDDEIDRTNPAPTGALSYTVTSVEDGNVQSGLGGTWPTCTDAPVLLPDGARITELDLWAIDNVTTEDLVVELLRKQVGTADPPQLVADISTIGNSAAVQIQLKSVDHVVDRVGFVYELRACLAGPALYNLVIQHDGPAGEALTRNPITVHPSAFRETSGLAEAVHRAAEGYVHSIWGTSVLVAPLALPDGAEITRLAATLSNPWDNPFRIELRRKRLNNLVPSEVLAEVASIGGDGSVQTPSMTDIIQPVVDSAYEYYLVAIGLEGTPQQRIFDVTVEHTAPIFSDGFESGDTLRWSNPDTTLTRTMVITSAAFRTNVSAYSSANPPIEILSRYDWTQGLFQLIPPLDDDWYEGACGVAPIQLPDGARIKAWTVWGYDADSSVDMTVELRRKLAALPASSAVVSTVVSSTASGSFGQLQTLDYPVDNFNQHLYFAWCIPFGANPGNFGLKGIELTWEP